MHFCASTVLLTASLWATLSHGQDVITACPSGETSIKAANGYTYRTCPNTDYQGTSAQVTNNIASMAACLDMCVRATACDKSVYDKRNRVCHLKGSDTYGLRWVVSGNQQFDSARRIEEGNVGKWGPLINLPVIPVAAYVVPAIPDSSRLLVFSSWGTNNFGGEGHLTQFADYNWKTGQSSRREISNTQHDMFCPGISALQDGRIVISGGSDAAATSIYNPSTNAFTRAADLKIARGYQSSTTLSNGKIFTIGGSYSGGIRLKPGEIYDPTTNQWSLLPDAKSEPMLTTDHEGAWRVDNHAWLFAWRNGTVFQAGPSKAMNWFGTTGSGQVQGAGTRETGNDAMCGINVMYDTGKILTAGGSQDYTNSDAFRRGHLITISDPFQPASVERIPDMRYQRGFANAVVLPNGQVLVTGGQRRSLVFTDTDSALAPELFDPATKTWRVLAEERIPRNYHSVAVLLADGTVFSGGGGLCYVNGRGNNDAHCNRAVDHANGQIFSPPYLFNSDGSTATRPIIRSVSAAQNLRPGATITVTMSNSNTGTSFALVRMGSVTHSINTDQRRISLTNIRQSSTRWTLSLPSDTGVLIPGYYYLFAVSSTGVPSVAQTIQVVL